MPDVNQNLNDTAAANLANYRPNLTNQTVTEPRSAVEAASDPSHGGSNPILWDLVSKVQPNLDPADHPVTIMSGLERIKRAVKGAESLVGEFEVFVVNMVGEVDGAATDVGEFAGSSITQLHRSADAVEQVFARLADLVKRAKAAHG